MSEFIPADPHLIPEARALLAFLHSIKGRYILAGQHNFISTGTKYSDLLREWTGRTPFVWGSDFSFRLDDLPAGRREHCGPLNLSDPGEDQHYLDATPHEMRQELVERCIAMHARGHVITLMWHQPLPWCGDGGGRECVWSYTQRPTPEEWQQLLTPGSGVNAQWCAQVDGIAGYLRQLADAHIPVMWRPHHEMNGVWFWWCNRRGPDGFPRLWDMLFERLVGHHGLHNLVWVWNTNAPRDREGDEAYAYELFYPDAARVDVLAADVYRRDYRQSHHDELSALGNGRPIALGEVGEVPTPDVLDAQPGWAWFMPWGHVAKMRANAELVPLLYQDPRVLALEDVARGADGAYEVSAR
jgi:mannan endo-1,4-beta-mannosidase